MILLILIAIIAFFFFNTYKEGFSVGDIMKSGASGPPQDNSSSGPNLWSPVYISYYNDIVQKRNNTMQGIEGYSDNEFLNGMIADTTEGERTSYLQNSRWPWDSSVQTFYTNVFLNSPEFSNDMMGKYYPVLYPNRMAYGILSKGDTGNQMLLGLMENQPTQGTVIKQLYTPDGISGLQCSNTPINSMNYTGGLTVSSIPSQIPGFTFISSPCDPCNVFNSQCQWSMNGQVDPFFSQVWNIGQTGV